MTTNRLVKTSSNSVTELMASSKVLKIFVDVIAAHLMQRIVNCVAVMFTIRGGRRMMEQPIEQPITREQACCILMNRFKWLDFRLYHKCFPES